MTHRQLWTLGREINWKLAAERVNTLRPSRDDLRKVAAGLAITQVLARRAWDRYTFGDAD